MARWAGFDTASFTYALPRPIPPGQSVWSCNPNNQSLAVYTANHYANRTPTSKYFGRYFHSDVGFSPFDPAEITALRAATFFYILPISAPDAFYQTMANQTGKDRGRADATTCINNIIAAADSGRGLTIPNDVYVYLDVEPGVRMSAWYWEGWSETIYNFVDGVWGQPFWPAVYATPSTVPGSNNKAVMDMLVSYNAAGDQQQHWCYGLWTTQPSYAGTDATTCNYSANNPGPTWDLAGGHPTGYSGLVLHHWQYALDENFWNDPTCSGCCDSCRPHVDNDQSDPNSEMTTYMLRIT
jgi:hypothetical protein